MQCFVREDDQEMSRDLITRSSDFEKEIFSWPINLGFGQRQITFGQRTTFGGMLSVASVKGKCSLNLLKQHCMSARQNIFDASSLRTTASIVWFGTRCLCGMGWVGGWSFLSAPTIDGSVGGGREGGRTHFVGAETTNLKCPWHYISQEEDETPRQTAATGSTH